MIYIQQGDLLQSDCTVIAHQCNCFATMGAGIAKQIKERYPEAYEADRNFPIPIGIRKRLGHFSKAEVGVESFIISMASIVMAAELNDTHHVGKSRPFHVGKLEGAQRENWFPLSYRSRFGRR
ncbi:MAG: hypothetical protein WB502_15090 [Thermoactinomyces sp.]